MVNQPSQLSGSFRVTSITLFTLPATIYHVKCGMPITIVYTAVFSLEGNLSGGIITFEYSTNMWQTTKVGSISVEAGKTSVSYDFSSFEITMDGMPLVESGIIRSVSPNQISSNIGKATGACQGNSSIW